MFSTTGRLIRVNMSRHMRLTHTTVHVCYWRCPVPSCSLWFTSELNGKEHIENTHHFREGRGYSFYECLLKFGLEWFGSRQFFSEKTTTGQSLWTDIALARRSGQELNNSYIVTGSPDFAMLRRFFIAVVAALQSRYDAMTARDYPLPMPQTRSLLDSMREDMYQHSSAPDARQSPVLDFPADESPVDLPVVSVATSVRPLTPANRSLWFLETGAPGSPCVPVLSSRAAVLGTCIASTDLLTFIDPLPIDRLALHNHHTAPDWPAEDRRQLLAVAHRDLYIAHRNVADLTRYLDDQAAQLAVYADAGDESVPLMTVDCLDVRALLLIRTLCLCARSYQKYTQTPFREITDCTGTGHL